MTVRPLAFEDLRAVEAIEIRCYRTPWTQALFATEVAKPTSVCLGAFGEDGLRGYAIGSRYPDAWHVMNVAVDPEHRQRGIATLLLERLLEQTDRDSPASHTLEVRVSNLAAIALYEKFGFVSRGVRPAYYADNREDALIMWRVGVGHEPDVEVGA